MTDDAPPRAAERALRALEDAARDARPRVDGDLADPDIPVAATAVMVRDGAEGVEVLLIERPDRGSFAGAWVFPGGKLDAVDAGARGEASSAEEADARRAAVRETREETGLSIDAADLVTLSCWDPPPGLPLRIRTWFFLLRAPEGTLRLQPDEAVAAEWMRPADALRRHARGELTLYPPTWVTLHGLADARDVEGLLAATRIGGPRTFETQVRRGRAVRCSTGARMPSMPATPARGIRSPAPPRGRLAPWVYTRRD